MRQGSEGASSKRALTTTDFHLPPPQRLTAGAAECFDPTDRISRQLLHNDPIALNVVQLELDRCGSFRCGRVRRLDRPRISPLARSRTMRQRRLMRLASLAGVSLAVRRRGDMARYRRGAL
jgi:hypothetical protein